MKWRAGQSGRRQRYCPSGTPSVWLLPMMAIPSMLESAVMSENRGGQLAVDARGGRLAVDAKGGRPAVDVKAERPAMEDRLYFRL